MNFNSTVLRGQRVWDSAATQWIYKNEQMVLRCAQRWRCTRLLGETSSVLSMKLRARLKRVYPAIENRCSPVLFAGRCDWLWFWELAFSGYGRDDLAAVKAAILDEDAGGLQAPYHYSCQVNSWNVALQ